MDEIISKKLSDIEHSEHVRILHAVESGSRAWGFESPDSDYDVRLIYVRPKEFYLRLDEVSDVIEWQLDETLDINGWDITKALKLLKKSNMTVFEWSNSPIVYKTTADWSVISNLANDYFRVKEGALHYLSTANRNYKNYILGKDSVKLKKYLYVLRPLLAAKWILSSQTPAPMLFLELVNHSGLDSTVKNAIKDLTVQKMELPEIGEGERIKIIDDYIDEQLLTLMSKTGKMSKEPDATWDKLNQTFLSIL